MTFIKEYLHGKPAEGHRQDNMEECKDYSSGTSGFCVLLFPTSDKQVNLVKKSV